MSSKRYRDLFEKKLDDLLTHVLSLSCVSLTNGDKRCNCYFIIKPTDGCYKFVIASGDYRTFYIEYNNGFHLVSDKYRCITNKISDEVFKQYDGD